MSEGKARRIDYSPDEYISGVAGVLKADEQGVYWMICTLIMSEGGPVAFNEGRLATLCGARRSRLRAIVDHLIELGKVTLVDGKLGQKRAQTEIERSLNRIQSARENGRNGGRPKKEAEQNQSAEKAPGSSDEKLTTNYQLPTEVAPNGALSETKVPDAKRSTRKPYPDDFEAAWTAYPTHRNMSKAEALTEWKKLSEADRALVLPSIPGYLAYLKTKPDLETIHFCRYLSKRRFEGHAGADGGGGSPEPVDWARRLNYARNNREWASGKWGPMPGRDGCRVPTDLLKPDDGKGWHEMRQVA